MSLDLYGFMVVDGLAHEMKDNFTIRVSFEFRRLILERLSESSVVVDFSVDGKEKLLVFRGDRLGTSVYRREANQSAPRKILTVTIQA